MTELTEVVLQLRHRIDVFAGPLCGAFRKLRGHEIKYREILESFKQRKVQREIEREMPHLVFHPVCYLYPPYHKSKNVFKLSPADIEEALIAKDPNVYGLARSWLPFFEAITGLRFPPQGRNDFLFRVYMSVRQRDTEGKEKKNVQRGVTAYSAKIINKAAMQNIIKGNVIAIVEGIDKSANLPPPAQHQLEDWKKSLDEGWQSNFFEKGSNNNQHQQGHKPGHKPTRCPKCNTYLTSWTKDLCHKCGWKA